MQKPLPKLENWGKTRDALQQAMQPLRSAGALGREPIINAIEYSTYPTIYGTTTGPLNFGGMLYLDFTKAQIGYWKDGKDVFTVSLIGENQTTLFDKVFAEFEKAGHRLEPDRSKITETTDFEIDMKVAGEIAELNYRMFSTVARFRARLFGTQTPVVLWPHGFDLSFIHFFKGTDEKKDPHINFGFVMAGVEKPFFYFYAWPVPEGLIGMDGILPKGGSWVEQWNTPGGKFEYDSFANEENPEVTAERFLIDIFEKVSPMMIKS